LSLLNAALWATGLALVVIAVIRAREPWGRLGELDAIDENARRYESWRGVRGPTAADGPTGADVMRQMLRRRLGLWAAIGIVGIVLIVAGFVVG
jgi:hypothetical protein